MTNETITTTAALPAIPQQPKPAEETAVSVMQFPTDRGAVVNVVADKSRTSCPYRWACSAGDAASEQSYASLPFARDDAKAHADACQAKPAVEARLVPATIGLPGRTQIVQIQCPEWCTEDHLGERESFLEDVTHTSDMVDVQVPTMLDPDTAHCVWYTRVASDPTASDPRLRAAHILISDCSAEDARLTPDMAEQLADDLAEFIEQIRAAARTARNTRGAA